MIPIDFSHAPTATKPRRTAADSQWQHYREEQKRLNLSVQANRRVATLREKLDKGSNHPRPLWVVVDGSYTNGRMLKNLPHSTVLTGRIRHDAKLYHLPRNPEHVGRRRVYGDRAATPGELLKDKSIPWQAVRAFGAGKYHDFKVKTISPLRWRSAGGAHDLRLIVVAPLAYRPRKGSRIFYRQPAYLVCTDTIAPVEKIFQAYTL